MRAQRHDASFRLDSATLPHVLRICRWVDGSPLGLELAAGWVGSLDVEGLADELARGSDALASRSKDVGEKHRSLKAALEKSWDLLEEDLRQVLRGLAVFRGGFRREAAAAVAGASVHRLADLVDRSLVRLESGGRYDLHPLVHQFCTEKLAGIPHEWTACMEAHGRYFRAQASAPDERVPNPPGRWRNLYERLELDLSDEALLLARAELPNLQQAWNHYLAVGDAESVAAVVDFHGNTAESWSRSREGFVLMKAALDALDADEPANAIARARVEGAAGVACWRLGSFDEGAALGERALEVLERLEPPNERIGCWWAAQAAGLSHFQSGRVARALEVLQLGHALADEGARAAKSAFLSRRLDGMAGLSAAVLGMSAVVAGDLTQARRWSLEARDRMFASTPRAAAYCFYPLASIALAEGDFHDAARWAAQGVAHARNVGHDAVLPDLWRSLGYALFRLERYPEATEVLAEALLQADRGGNLVYGTPLRATLGRTLVRMHRPAEAIPLLLRALRDAAAVGAVPYALDDALLGLAEVAAARGDHLAMHIARFVAELASAQPLARMEARAMLVSVNGTEPGSSQGLETLMAELDRAFG
jgi:tetratricopeptide (TPR) repeat protein